VKDAPTLFKFEKVRGETIHKVATAIARRVRGHADRVTFAKLSLASLLGRAVRRSTQKAAFEKERAAVRLLSWYRTKAAVRQRKRMEGALAIQTMFRGYSGRVHAANFKDQMQRRAAAITLQSLAKGYLAKKHYLDNQEALRKAREEAIRVAKNKLTLNLQSVFRGMEARVATKRKKLALTIQQFARGIKARETSKLFKAATTIREAYRYSVRYRYLKSVVKCLQPMQSAENCGKACNTFHVPAAHKITYRPTGRTSGPRALETASKIAAPTDLDATQALLLKMQRAWWASNKIAGLSESSLVHMRDKVITLNLFEGNKPWTCARHHQAEYMEEKAIPVYEAMVKALYGQNGDNQVLFAMNSIKVNRHGKSQNQVIIVSDRNIYKYKPKSFKQIKQQTPLNGVKAIHLSPHNDGFIIIEMDPASGCRDMVLDLFWEGEERYSEITTVIYKQLKESYNRTIPVTFGTEFLFDNARLPEKKTEPFTMVWEKNPKPAPPAHYCKWGTAPKRSTIFYTP